MNGEEKIETTKKTQAEMDRTYSKKTAEKNNKASVRMFFVNWVISHY